MDRDRLRRFGIDELADLGGVSRRTVRYYIQEGLLPAPYGVGRGDHYGTEHLEALLKVKALQESGQSLEQIRQPASPSRQVATGMPPVPKVANWRRITLGRGVELHVSDAHHLPSAAGLRSLAEWCREFLERGDGDVDASH